MDRRERRAWCLIPIAGLAFGISTFQMANPKPCPFGGEDSSICAVDLFRMPDDYASSS